MQVFDQNLNFVCLEHNLFTLNQEKSYKKLNSPLTRDIDIEESVDATSTALFAVLNTLNVIPLIKSSKSNAAEMIAKKLNTKLKDHISNNGGNGDLNRPTLVIVDRIIDLQTMLCHSWTYVNKKTHYIILKASMLNDVLGMHQMKISLKTEKGIEKFDIDVNDFFWLKNATLPFPIVAGIKNNH